MLVPSASSSSAAASGVLRPGTEHGRRLEMHPVTVAAQRKEVIRVDGDVDTQVFALGDGVADGWVRGVLRGDLHADANRTVLR